MLKTAISNFLIIASVALLGNGFASAQMDAHSEPTMNFHRINDRLATGGHLLDGGAAALKEQGISVVINLRDDAPTGEQAQFVEQGIEWISIPVEWRNPENANYERFSQIMNEHQDDHILVQCSSNYRASAMVYLYQVRGENVPEQEAIQSVLAIWDPSSNSTWTRFMNGVKSGN